MFLTHIAKTAHGVRLSEASPEFGGYGGGTIDSDDHLFRRLSQTKRDLSPLKFERAVNISYYLYDTDPLFKRLVDVPIQAITSAGIEIKAEDDKVQEILEDFWADPISGFKNKFMDTDGLLKDAVLCGELDMPVATNAVDGSLEYGYIDPVNVEDIELLNGNPLVPDKIILKADGGKPKQRIDIVRLREGVLLGKAFHFALNKPVNAKRGRPTYMALLDWVDLHGQALFSEAERWVLMKAFLYDIEIKGGEQEVKKWYEANPDQAAGLPFKPGSLHIHNENVKITEVSPDLKAADGTVMENMMRRHVSMGAALSDVVLGYGDTTNVGEAKEIMTATLWMIEHMQRVLTKILTAIFTYLLQEAAKAGRVTDDGVLSEKDNLEFKIKCNKVLPRTIVNLSTAFQQVTASLVTAMSSRLIGEKRAREIYVFALNQMGYEITTEDVEEEFEEMEGEESNVEAEIEKMMNEMKSQPVTPERELQVRESVKRKLKKLRRKSNGKYAYK